MPRALWLGNPAFAVLLRSSNFRWSLNAARPWAIAMKYVYILASKAESDRFYVGLTDDLRTRLKTHNQGHVAHTSKYVPWTLNTYIAFSDPERAVAFERYLKSGSGRAFAKKRL